MGRRCDLLGQLSLSLLLLSLCVVLCRHACSPDLHCCRRRRLLRGQARHGLLRHGPCWCVHPYLVCLRRGWCAQAYLVSSFWS